MRIKILNYKITNTKINKINMENKKEETCNCGCNCKCGCDTECKCGTNCDCKKECKCGSDCNCGCSK
jgi:hypothetical protein